MFGAWKKSLVCCLDFRAVVAQLSTLGIMTSSPIETRIFDHVIGNGCPLDDLLQKGTISPKWVDTYLELLAEAKQTWLNQAHWPRELVAAIHMVSWVLDSRYRAWLAGDEGRCNSKTEELLSAVTSKSHIFLDTPALERGRLGV
jgi:hypothetical protein